MTDAQTPARPAAILLDERDTAAVALVPLTAGTEVEIRRGAGTMKIVTDGLIPFGHKVAVAPMAAGAPVVKYGEVIGFATTDIRPGQHVHVHNVRSDRAKVNDV
jgi:altronate dehydratase small subunit